MADRSVVVRLRAEVDGLKRGMAEATKAVKGFGDEAQKSSQRATTASERLITSATANRQAWEKSGRAMVVTGAALAAGIGLAVKTFMDFDAQMSQVKTLSHATGRQMDQLTDAALTMGQAIGFSATQTAQAETELVKAGLSVADIMGGALKGALDLAAAGQIDVAQATEIAASAMTQFKLSGKDVPHIADLLAAGADKALGGVGDLGVALSSAGTVAAQFGWSLEETVGTLAEFAQNAQIGEKGGTLLRQMLLQLVNPSKQARDLMDQYGLSITDANGEMVSSSELAGRLQKSFGGLTPEVRNHALAVIFGAHAIQGANILMSDGAKVNADWVASVNDAGFAAQQAAGKMDNLKGDLAKLKAALENDLIKTGSAANGSLRTMTQAVTGVAKAYGALPQPLQATALGLGGLASVTALAGGSFLMLAPRVIEGVKAFRKLQETAPLVTTSLTNIGKAAAVAAGIVVVTNAVNAATRSFVGAPASIDKTTKALLEMGTSTEAVDKLIMGTSDNVAYKFTSLADAAHKIANPTLIQRMSDFSGEVKGVFTGGQNGADGRDAMIKQLNAVGDALGQMVASGHGDVAAEQFKRLADEWVAGGGSLATFRGFLPGYTDALAAADSQQKLAADSASKVAGGLDDAGSAAADAVPVTRSVADAMMLLGPSANAGDKAVTDLAKSLDDYQQKVSDAFTSSTDVLTKFTIDTGKKAGSAASQLTATYKTTLAQAQAFATNIGEATRRGLDPQIIARLLEAGPAAAGPALQTIVADHSGRLIKMANTAEAQLSAIQARVVEQSRLTNLAMHSNTDAMVKDLSTAMQIATIEADKGGRATAAALAKQLGIGAAEVERIAKEFGISIATNTASGTAAAGRSLGAYDRTIGRLPTSHETLFKTPGLANAIDDIATLRARILNLPTQQKVQILYERHVTGSIPGGGIGVVRPAGGGTIMGPGVLKRGDGGTVTGQGGPRQDNIPALLSVGEEVIKADQASRWRPVLKAINAGKFADGGTAGRFVDASGIGSARAGSSRPVVQRIYQISGVVNPDIDRLASAVVQRIRETESFAPAYDG